MQEHQRCISFSRKGLGFECFEVRALWQGGVIGTGLPALQPRRPLLFGAEGQVYVHVPT